jgi:pimeloyl-ACP methyl ester carboxylesterase
MTAPQTAATELVKVGRSQLRVAVSGTGRPLLLLNGVGGNLEMWDPLVPALNAETIAYDAPGTGHSGTPWVPLPIPALARQAVRLLDTLGFTEVDVLGISLGGVIAQQVAIRYPERVRRLVLASTTWGMPAFPGRIGAWRTLLSPARYYLPGHYERRAAQFLGGRTGRDPEVAHSVTCTNCGAVRPGRTCRGCTGSRLRRWCWPATTTRSCPYPTPASSPG